MIHVVIAEDKARMAEALKADVELRLDLRVAAMYGNGQALLDGLASLKNLPDVALLDIDMPELDGVATAALLKEKHPQIVVLMVTIFEGDDKLFDAIRAGADGYLLKGTAPAELHRYIDEALDGGAPMSPTMASKALRLLRDAPTGTVAKNNLSKGEELTFRELGVLEQLASGITYQQAADNLNISLGTVRKHVEHLYRKLRVDNRTLAVKRGRERGLL